MTAGPIVLLAAWRLIAWVGPSPSRAVSLCRLFSAPEAYAGQTVRVRAEMRGWKNSEMEVPPRRSCGAFAFMVIRWPRDEGGALGPSPGARRRIAMLKKLLQHGRVVVATVQGRVTPILVMRGGRQIRVAPGPSYGLRATAVVGFEVVGVVGVEALPTPSVIRAGQVRCRLIGGARRTAAGRSRRRR